MFYVTIRIRVNGPPIKHFDAALYASNWIKEGHLQTDAETGIGIKNIEEQVQSGLF